MITPPTPPGPGQPPSAHRYPPPAPPAASAVTGQPPGPGYPGAAPPPPNWDSGRPYPPSAPPPAWPAADTGKPSAYWPLSIVAILFSVIFGAIAIYFSSEVGNRWNRGDREGARKASKTALILGLIGVGVGLILIVAVVANSGSSYGY